MLRSSYEPEQVKQIRLWSKRLDNCEEEKINQLFLKSKRNSLARHVHITRQINEIDSFSIFLSLSLSPSISLVLYICSTFVKIQWFDDVLAKNSLPGNRIVCDKNKCTSKRNHKWIGANCYYWFLLMMDQMATKIEIMVA